MWETIRDQWTKQVDVKPIGDLKDHPDGPGCWCDPDCEVINEWWITTHHAADKREYFEKDTTEKAEILN